MKLVKYFAQFAKVNKKLILLNNNFLVSQGRLKGLSKRIININLSKNKIQFYWFKRRMKFDFPSC